MVSRPVTTRSISRSVLLTSALAAAGCSQGPKGPHAPGGATLVLVGGRVHALDPDAPAGAAPTAIAISGERIVAVGGDAEVRRLAGPGARVIELAARR